MEKPERGNASTQTFLCTPPSSISHQDKMKGHRTSTPEPVAVAVYSSFTRGGTRRTADQGHGGPSPADSNRHGPKAGNGKDERELARVLGKSSKGTSTWNVHKMKVSMVLSTERKGQKMAERKRDQKRVNPTGMRRE